MDITLSKYQADVFLRTEELYSTIGFRNVPLFEDEYRLSKATAEYITNNISVSGGNIENDAIQTYNAVLGIIVPPTGTGTTTPTGTSTTTNGTTNGTTGTGTILTNTIGTLGFFGDDVSIRDYLDGTVSFPFLQNYTFSYTGNLTTGTQLTDTSGQNIPPSRVYYLIQSSSDFIYSTPNEYYIEVLNGSLVSPPRLTSNIQSSGAGSGGSNGGPINPV